MVSKKISNIESAIAAIDAKAAKLSYRRAELVKQLEDLKSKSSVHGVSGTPSDSQSPMGRGSERVVWCDNPLERAALIMDPKNIVIGPAEAVQVTEWFMAGMPDGLEYMPMIRLIDNMNTLAKQDPEVRRLLSIYAPVNELCRSKLARVGLSPEW